MKHLLFFLFTILAIGCAHPKLANPTPLNAFASSEPPAELAKEIVKTDSEIEKPETTPDNEAKTPISEHPTILIEMNEQVNLWVDRFTKRNPEVFVRLMEKGRPYRTMIEETLISHGVPKEFFYLALIESGYSNKAVSGANAVGIWQFICGTAQRYNLKCNRSVDERRHPIKSTRAAAKYLRDLYNVFGSWRLAMAAYNAGEHRILGAIMRGKTRDFWTLAEKGFLPRETMHYVPKFLAAVIVGSNPEKYGLTIANGAIAPLASRFDESALKGRGRYAVRKKFPTIHVVRRNDNLSSLSKQYRVPIANLKRWNGLKNSRIRYGARLRVRAPARASKTVYRVKRGDTLTAISERFDVSIQKLKNWNGLETGVIYRGQKLVVNKGA